MTVRQHRTSWMVDVAVKGERIREYGFKNRALAKARENELKQSGGAVPKHQTLVEFVDRWYELHGRTLRDEYRYPRTRKIAERIGGYVKDFTVSKFSRYRFERLNEVSVSTVNHETRYFRALFSEMIRLGHYFSESPMAKIKTFKENQRELEFLDDDQIGNLLNCLAQSKNKYVLIVAKICLSTGARWGEAESLRVSDLIVNDSVCMLRFAETKNGQVRYVQISRSLASEVLEVGNASGLLFSSAKYAFRSTVKRFGIELPEQQATHILRHTFASHFMMNGGDILTLQKILGHSDIKLTMRYAHLSPDHLAAVLDLNPLERLHNGYLTATK